MRTESESRSYLDLIIGFIVGLTVATWASDCRADDWATMDKVLFGTFVVASAYDAAQTIQALDERWPNGTPKYREMNPLFGDNPSDRVLIISKVVEAGIIFLLADRYPKVRRPLLWVANVVQISVVAHNLSIGMNVEF